MLVQRFLRKSPETFVFESVAFNLAELQGKQFVAVVTTQIENPLDINEVAQEYAKALTKSPFK